jgi:hypothetical protein
MQTNRNWLMKNSNGHPFTTSPGIFGWRFCPWLSLFPVNFPGPGVCNTLAGLVGQRDLPIADMLNRYELYMYKQWLRVYMRSKMIKHNKDLLESMDDPFKLLELLHIY